MIQSLRPSFVALCLAVTCLTGPVADHRPVQAASTSVVLAQSPSTKNMRKERGGIAPAYWIALGVIVVIIIIMAWIMISTDPQKRKKKTRPKHNPYD